MLEVEALVQRTLRGERDGWRELQAVLEPKITAIARRSHALRSRGLAANDDDVREVTVASFERLARQDFRNLRNYLERFGAVDEASFADWIYGAVEYVIREHLRRRYGAKPSADADGAPRPSKRDLNSHAGRLADHHDSRELLDSLRLTTKLTAQQIMEYIAREFTAQEADALRLYYLDGYEFEELAAVLGLGDARAADRLIRRLNARLRYRFLAEG